MTSPHNGMFMKHFDWSDHAETLQHFFQEPTVELIMMTFICSNLTLTFLKFVQIGSVKVLTTSRSTNLNTLKLLYFL